MKLSQMKVSTTLKLKWLWKNVVYNINPIICMIKTCHT